ncbi:MAG: murein biosynthesis integral membrane protein MurJ, partial [bacterium]|nr:murein biosynthesis integral membrane protein MurJ [bacterium]
MTDNTLNRQLGKAALIVSGGVLLSRILGQLREIIFAGLLGADGITDQYVAAFRIPDFLNYLLAGGFLSITFIPIFARYIAEDDEEGGWAALSAILRPITIGILGLVAIGYVAAPWVIETIYPEFTASQIDATVRLTRIVLPAQVFFVLGALFSAVQYAKGVFTIPTIAPIIYNLGIIAGGLTYAQITGAADPEGFIWGALGGAFVGNFALQWWGARRVGMKLTLGITWRHPALRSYLAIALPLMIGQSIVVLDETFMSTFGGLVGDGAQTHLLYARRTMFVPIGVVAQAAGVAAYPFLAQLFAEGKKKMLADTVDKTLRWVLALSVLAAGAIASLAVPTIRTLFERSAFGPEDTAAAAGALFFYSLAIPIWGGLQVLNRAFYARTQMWTPVVIGSATTALAIPIYWAMRRGFGLEGVAAASVLSLGLYAVALGIRWYRDPDHQGRVGAIIDGAGRALPLAVAGGTAAWAAANVLANLLGDSFLASVATLGLS